MHLSMHNWMRSEPLEVTLARLAKFGYESIEIKGEPDQYETGEVRALLDKYGLCCWGLTRWRTLLRARQEQSPIPWLTIQWFHGTSSYGT